MFNEVMPEVKIVKQFTDVLMEEPFVQCLKCGSRMDTTKMFGNIHHCKCHYLRLVNLRDYVELTFPAIKIKQLQRNF